MPRDRAPGTSSFCISILHLPLPRCFHCRRLAEVPQPHSEYHRHLQPAYVHVSQILLCLSAFAPGIEDTFLDFEIILCKTLPGTTCRGTSSHHFHSVQQFGFKAPGFGKKQRAAQGCWQNKGENYPLPTAFSWTLLLSSLFSRTQHSLSRFKTHFSPYISYLPTDGRYPLSSDASCLDSFCCDHNSAGSLPSPAQEINDHSGTSLTENVKSFRQVK